MADLHNDSTEILPLNSGAEAKPTSGLDPETDHSGTRTIVYAWLVQLLACIFVIIGNTFICFILLRSRLIKSRGNVFIFTLVCCDLTRGLVLLIWTCVTLSMTTLASIPGACEGLAFLASIVNALNCFVVMLVIFDRLVFVQAPVNYLHRMTRRIVVIILIYAALHVTLLSLLPNLGWGQYSFSTITMSCEINWVSSRGYAIFMVLWGYIFPMGVTTVVFYKMSNTVKEKLHKVRIYNNNTMEPIGLRAAISNTIVTEADMSFMNTLKILTSLFLVYIVSWLPYCCMVFGLAVHPSTPVVPPVLYVFIKSLTLLTSCVNPWLYGTYNRKFQATFKSVMTFGRQTESDVMNFQQPRERTVSLVALNDYPLDLGAIENRRRFQALSLRPDQVKVNMPQNVWN